MESLTDEARWSALIEAEDKALTLFDAIEAAGIIAPGRSERQVDDDIAALALERDVLAPFDVLKAGLEAAGLAQDRRALRLLPAHLQWRWRDAHTLQVGFDLPPGCYATVVLRELADTARPE